MTREKPPSPPRQLPVALPSTSVLRARAARQIALLRQSRNAPFASLRDVLAGG